MVPLPPSVALHCADVQCHGTVYQTIVNPDVDGQISCAAARYGDFTLVRCSREMIALDNLRISKLIRQFRTTTAEGQDSLIRSRAAEGIELGGTVRSNCA